MKNKFWPKKTAYFYVDDKILQKFCEAVCLVTLISH